LRTIDENMKEQDGDENVDFETRGNTEDTDIESVLEVYTIILRNLDTYTKQNRKRKKKKELIINRKKN
jgi:hypothetical protein